jgi:hypothetical protein
MYSIAAKKMVADQIMNMFDNNILNECGFESFISWVEDGATFRENYKGATQKQIEEAIALAKEIAPNLDEISWKIAPEIED